MWLEHLLFGAVNDTSFAVDCKVVRSCAIDGLFDIYGLRRRKPEESSLTSLRKDNEVKLEERN